MNDPYLLRKRGMWYAHNSAGYVSRVEMAELYTKEYAENHARGCEEVTAIPFSSIDWLTVEEIQEYIDRLEAMKEALS